MKTTKSEEYAINNIIDVTIFETSVQFWIYHDTSVMIKHALFLMLASDFITIDYSEIAKDFLDERHMCIGYAFGRSLKSIWMRQIYDQEVITHNIRKCVYKLRGIKFSQRLFGLQFPR